MIYIHCKSGSCSRKYKFGSGPWRGRAFFSEIKSTKIILKDSSARLYLPESGVIIHSVADPHQLDSDPDPACHFDADPDLTFHFDADADPDPRFQATLEKVPK